MTDEIRDADGCEDFESLEESGLHEETEAETVETAETEIVEEAKEETDAAEAALQEANDKYMRLFAEFDNYRKRTAKEKAETYQDAVAKTVLELLPAVDSFERAMESPCTDEAYRSGMEKIYSQMKSCLTKLGVEEIPSLNEPFDPKVHNAIRQVEDENFGESTVCEVYQKGYRLGDRIVRCAMVAVAN
ncbi:MAG: nucleotide exchange factor GrpE [Oscillospiraceae bacterium]|nr:nucleotide exchange factor GrpE [Oscillospiraceae bacterium]